MFHYSINDSFIRLFKMSLELILNIFSGIKSRTLFKLSYNIGNDGKHLIDFLLFKFVIINIIKDFDR